MTTDHRAEAAKYLVEAEDEFMDAEGDSRHALAAAQVHATLAEKQDSVRPLLATLVERWEEVAEAFKPEDMGGEWDDITRRYQHYRQTYLKAIRDVEFILDEGKIPCQLLTVEERRRGDCGHSHTGDDGAGRTARKSVLARPAPDDDPWAPTPTVTVDLPEPVRRVIAGHLAEMLLDHSGEEGAVHTWARGIAFELKRVGVDLDDSIRKRITDLTFGPVPSDPPF